MKKLWYKFLSWMIGSYVREEITFYIGVSKLVESIGEITQEKPEPDVKEETQTQTKKPKKGVKKKEKK